jgi:hypothetical protein
MNLDMDLHWTLLYARNMQLGALLEFSEEEAEPQGMRYRVRVRFKVRMQGKR